MMHKKSQVATEFMIMTGIAIFAMLIFIGVLFHNTARVGKERLDYSMEDFTYSVQYEFDLAGRVKDGYYRELVLPQKIDGRDYTITIQDNVLIVNSGGHEYYKSLPNMTVYSGPVKGTSNIIQKIDGRIYLN